MDISPGPTAVIAVCGELDLASAPAFEAALGRLDLPSLHRAVLDLERLDFIDATGLRTVLALHAVCREASVHLSITPGPRQVQRLFELTGMDQLLPFRRAD